MGTENKKPGRRRGRLALRRRLNPRRRDENGLTQIGWALTGMLALAVAIAAVVIGALLAVGRFRGFQQEPLTAAALYDLLKIGFAFAAGIGGVVALVTAYRRQRVAELAHALDARGENREETKAFNERFATAAGQLGNDNPQVRLAGVYAMAGLADDWEGQRQTCVDVLCAYLRMPYNPNHFQNTQDPSALREVRHALIRVISGHLRPDAARSRSMQDWRGLDLDFTGAFFDGGDFTGCEFSGGRVDFRGAEFRGGSVSFAGAEFSGGSVEFSGAEFSGSWINFMGAEFSGGRIGFGDAKFSKGRIDFLEAKFSGGQISFSPAEFSGCDVNFSLAEFSGSWIGFGGAKFLGGTVGFTHTKFSSGTIGFGAAEFSGCKVSFNNADFSGSKTSFLAAKFSGGEVSFHGTRFSKGSVDFKGAKFSNDQGDFTSAEFSGSQVDFHSASWSGSPKFPLWDTWPSGVRPPSILAPEEQE